MTIDEVLSFWLGDVDVRGIAPPEAQRRWWVKDPAFDALVRERFGALHEALAGGAHEEWLRSPRGAAATVVVLDQFSRNMFRDDPRMYAYDARALTIAEDAIAEGFDDELGLHARFFLYMPGMHAEDLDAQERCVARMRQLAALDPSFERNVEFAIAHRDIVARFGRFPHRNAILGRASTPEEIGFLKQPGSSF